MMARETCHTRQPQFLQMSARSTRLSRLRPMPSASGICHYQIELLTNLDKVPEAGAIVVVAFPKPKGGSGFPARVFAIVP